MTYQNILITGASRGIGKGIALYLASKGFNLILTCKNNNHLLIDLQQQLTDFPVKVFTFQGDMSNYQTVTDLFNQLEQQHFLPDIVINNCGISHVGLLSDMCIEDWHDILNSNLTSAFCCSKLAIPHMVKRQSGCIINISSVWGNVGASCETAYSATKGGLNAFTKALAKELAPSHIPVNAIACGAIDTDMLNFLDTDEKQQLIDEIPANRLGTPLDIAQTIYQLIQSPTYLTGQVISLDGGWC